MNGSIREMANTLPKWVGGTYIMAQLPSVMRRAVQYAMEQQVAIEKERQEADSIGISVEDYRIIKAFPGLIDATTLDGFIK